MYKFKEILVPADFSGQFRLALNYARELALSAGSAIHLIHVIEPALIPPDIAIYPNSTILDVQNQIRQNADERLNEYSNEIVQDNIQLKTALLSGVPANKILDYAQENHIDLICMAAHGRSGFERFMMGSTAEKVLRKADCPVIVIRMPGYKSEGVQAL